MRRLLQISVAGALLATGCSGMKLSSQTPGLPLHYREARYGLNFSLPASWRGYSVSIQWFENTRFSSTEDGRVVLVLVITLRHPQWRADVRYQDIPILVFTR